MLGGEAASHLEADMGQLLEQRPYVDWPAQRLYREELHHVGPRALRRNDLAGRERTEDAGDVGLLADGNEVGREDRRCDESCAVGDHVLGLVWVEHGPRP